MRVRSASKFDSNRIAVSNPLVFIFTIYTNITVQSNDRQVNLHQPLMAVFWDNLRTTCRSIFHHEEPVTLDEDLDQTNKETVVVLKLQLIHRSPTHLVK